MTFELTSASYRLIWGPWHLPGILGIINNVYACTYMIFVIFWSVWPPDAKVTASTMNYSVVVTGGVLILSAIWYFVRAKHIYKGPTIDEVCINKCLVLWTYANNVSLHRRLPL